MLKAYGQRVAAAFRAVFTRAWWQDVAEASVAQGWQILVPFFLTVQVTGKVTGGLLAAAAWQLAGGEVVVIVRRLTGLTVPAGADLATRALARSLSAFAGAVAGFIGTTALGDVVTGLSWPTILVSSASTAVLALLHRTVEPATTDVTQTQG